MNFDTFLAALNKEEIAELSAALHSFQKKSAEINAAKIQLSDGEKQLAKQNKIKAITELRVRTNCNLYTAKIAIENYLESRR